MTTMHRVMGTWAQAVDLYIALTEFGRRKFIEGGFPPHKIIVKPNFTEDPGVGDHRGGEVVFVGRLSPEKGIGTLIEAWRRVVARRPGARLKIVGQGPLETLRETSPPGVEWHGWQPHEQLIRIMQRASLLVFPSEHYEGFPMALVEAFATGLPVVAAKIGAAAEVIRDRHTGRFYRPGDPEDLADVLEELLANEPMVRDLGRQARARVRSEVHPTAQLRPTASRLRACRASAPAPLSPPPPNRESPP